MKLIKGTVIDGVGESSSTKSENFFVIRHLKTDRIAEFLG